MLKPLAARVRPRCVLAHLVQAGLVVVLSGQYHLHHLRPARRPPHSIPFLHGRGPLVRSAGEVLIAEARLSQMTSISRADARIHDVLHHRDVAGRASMALTVERCAQTDSHVVERKIILDLILQRAGVDGGLRGRIVETSLLFRRAEYFLLRVFRFLSMDCSHAAFAAGVDAYGAEGDIRPSGAAINTRPSGAAEEIRPSGAAIGIQPSGAAIGIQPTGAAGENRPSVAARDIRPTGAAGEIRPSGAAIVIQPTGAAGENRPSSASPSRNGGGVKMNFSKINDK